MQLPSLMDWLRFFFLSHSSIGMGLISEPVTTGSYSGRRVATELRTGLRAWPVAAPAPAVPGRQTLRESEPHFALIKTGATSVKPLGLKAA